MKTKLNHFKLNLSFFSLLLTAMLFSAGIGIVNGQVFKTTKCLPPDTSEYAAQYHQTYNGVNVYNLNDLIHLGFSNCKVPSDSIGGTTFDSFSSTIKATLRINNGPPMLVNAPGQCNVRVTKTGQNGNTAIYQTEMLQLDISGGSLPAGTMIRESPTLQSMGQTTIQTVSGGFIINSFFDVFTELSTDNGLSWTSSSGPGHVVLRPSGSTGIPTLSQWGLIILGLLLLSMGIVVVRKKELAVAGFENSQTTNYFLFDKRIYGRVLAIVLILAAVGLVISRFFYGTLSLTDIFGTVASSFIVSYIVHLYIGHKKEN